MNLSVNGHSKVPPGFRFHPTEEELLQYYLMKKVASEKIDLDVIRDVDLNKLEPWDIQEKCRIGSGPQNDWYFFSHKDKKYPTGTRTNRATAAGFWKATGRDKMIYSNLKRIGMRKTLVFYKGRAPHGEKSDWIMHEYRLEDCTASTNTVVHDHPSVSRQDNYVSCSEDGWVICRVFRKKNYQKAVDNNGPRGLPTDDDQPQKQHQLLNLSSKKALDHFFSCMEKENNKTTTFQDEMNNHDQPTTSINTNFIPTYTTCCTQNSPETPQGSLIINHNHNHNHVLNTNYPSTNQDQYINLPMLTSSSPPPFDPVINSCYEDDYFHHADKARLSDWMTLDRLIASQLDGQDQDLCFREVV